MRSLQSKIEPNSSRGKDVEARRIPLEATPAAGRTRLPVLESEDEILHHVDERRDVGLRRVWLDSTTETIPEAAPPGSSGGSDRIPTRFVTKPRSQYTAEEKAMYNANAKALNVIFNGVDGSLFGIICTCTTAKAAWDALHATFEGSEYVRKARFELVESQFNRLKMHEGENILDYSIRFKGVVNHAHMLGLVYDKRKLVYKMLGTVTREFYPKVIVLQDLEKIETMSLDEIIGILKVYELIHLQSKQGKVSGIKSNKPQISDNVICYGCNGFGHIRSQCPTAKRKDSKAIGAT
ncbi:uncharacterized protein LOC127244727 [Andrographis paniculata]|uniref:uncharacterized protein LOC127244727 n=1 Tax=Andrographis paniculata TaxID=175694 RepID=UPI0021E8F7BF|nr:uncharacterized protein LOC127244727 [Andrographis paniculata]